MKFLKTSTQFFLDAHTDFCHLTKPNCFNLFLNRSLTDFLVSGISQNTNRHFPSHFSSSSLILIHKTLSLPGSVKRKTNSFSSIKSIRPFSLSLFRAFDSAALSKGYSQPL